MMVRPPGWQSVRRLCLRGSLELAGAHGLSVGKPLRLDRAHGKGGPSTVDLAKACPWSRVAKGNGVRRWAARPWWLCGGEPCGREERGRKIGRGTS